MELQVTFNNPIVFGDESYHARISQYIAEEVEYPAWSPLGGTELFKTSFAAPPLWHTLIASFLYLFGFNEIFIRFLPPFVTFLTGLAVFLLGKELYDEKIGFIASIIAITIPSFATYSVLIYTDALVTLFMTMFFLLFCLYIKRGGKIYSILSGIFGAFAFLTKPSGIAVYIFIFLAFVYELIKKRKFYEPLKKYFILSLILILVPSTFFLRNFFYYKTPMCAGIPFINRVLDVSGCAIGEFEGKYKYAGITEQAGTEQSIYRMGLTNYLNFAYGELVVLGIRLPWVILALFSGLFVVLSKRDKSDIFVLLMLSIVLLIFLTSTGRAEDTARYTLIWSPFIALLAGKWFSGIYEFIKEYQKYIALIVFIIVVILSYINLKGKLDVMAQVKQFSPSFFEACDWIKENTAKDAVISTFWSSRALYNCQRNSAGAPADLRLSDDVNYTLSVAKQYGTTHIFIQKFSIDPQNRHLKEKFDLDFVNLLEAHPEYFKKVYENGPPLQQCLQQGGCDGNIVYEINYTLS